VTAVDVPRQALLSRCAKVGALLDVKPYVLRYWGERSSASCGPARRRSQASPLPPQGRRDAARDPPPPLRRALHHRRRQTPPAQQHPARQAQQRTSTDGRKKLAHVREELRDLCHILERDPAPPAQDRNKTRHGGGAAAAAEPPQAPRAPAVFRRGAFRADESRVGRGRERRWAAPPPCRANFVRASAPVLARLRAQMEPVDLLRRPASARRFARARPAPSPSRRAARRAAPRDRLPSVLRTRC